MGIKTYTASIIVGLAVAILSVFVAVNIRDTAEEQIQEKAEDTLQEEQLQEEGADPEALGPRMLGSDELIELEIPHQEGESIFKFDEDVYAYSPEWDEWYMFDSEDDTWWYISYPPDPVLDLFQETN